VHLSSPRIGTAIIPALQAGKFDAIVASMFDHAGTSRKGRLHPQYYNTPSALAAPKDTTLKGVTKEDLAGKTVGVATTTTHFNYASKTYTDSPSRATRAAPRSRPTSPMAV